MRKFAVVLFIILGSFILVNAQRGRNPAPQPPTGDPSPINSDRQQDISQRSDNLRLTERFPAHTTVNSKIYREHIRPLYRDPTKDELKKLAPESADEQAYAGFLSAKNTGLTRLMADKGCDRDFGVIVSTPYCVEYSMPGAGASFSFRKGEYRIRQFGDLIFTGSGFAAVGVLTHGIFADIGDVPLEQVSAETAGVRYLLNIQPATDMAESEALTEKLINGFTEGDFTYQSSVLLRENTTYVLRSIAYRGNIYRSIGGLSYDELDFDKRRDITVAFRVVRSEENVSATILWKELADEKSPKLDVLEEN